MIGAYRGVYSLVNAKPWIPEWILTDLAGVSELTKPDIGQPISLLTIIKAGGRWITP